MLAGKAVLGIDAAWTEHHASGVALIARDAVGWKHVASASSYRQFLERAGVEVPVDKEGWPGADVLLEAARRLAGTAELVVVSVDMPLATSLITARRVADNEVSRAFGARGCAVHSPTAERPGVLATRISEDFARVGFPLEAKKAGMTPRLIEVYPHPALLTLCGKEQRLPYKVSRAHRYWPELSAPERVDRLRGVWREILDALAVRLHEIPLEVPPAGAPLAALKSFEDTLDALICAWTGAEYAHGHAAAYGDATAAIWVPVPTL